MENPPIETESLVKVHRSSKQNIAICHALFVLHFLHGRSILHLFLGKRQKNRVFEWAKLEIIR